MKPFMDKDFLLDTDTAKVLYHEHAAKMPIIDYHCHINPMEIAKDKQYGTITEIWLGGKTQDGGYFGDHYKWRLMRSNGVQEELITGDADPEEGDPAPAEGPGGGIRGAAPHPHPDSRGRSALRRGAGTLPERRLRLRSDAGRRARAGICPRGRSCGAARGEDRSL